MSAASNQDSAPRKLGVYTLDRKIGSGAMGDVYEATHEALSKKVALKVLRNDGLDGEMRRRFLQEGVAASRVRHPNVVEVTDAGVDGETAYLAMQLLDGETLAEYLEQDGRLPLTYAIDLILPVVSALDAAHQAGVLHRDMKPGNIFLADVGRGEPEPMLLDFGISKLLGPVDAVLTQNQKFLGTPLYIAPEQADGEPGTKASDQYSLALTLYECLLGIRPHERLRNNVVKLLHAVAEANIKPLRSLDPSIPEPLEDAIMKALSKDPADRFSSVREFGGTLLPFASTARFALWQHSFVDAERTMASASAPVSDRSSNRRVSVSVEAAPRYTLQHNEAASDDGAGTADDSFTSHDSLFGGADTNPDTVHPDFDGARSSISRRGGRMGTSLERAERTTAPSPAPSPAASPAPSPAAPSPAAPSLTPASPAAPSPSPVAPLSHMDAPSDRPVSDHWGGLPSSRTADSKPSPRRWSAYILAIALVLCAIFATVIVVRNELGPADTYTVHVRTIPPGATLELDGQSVGSGEFHGAFRADGKSHRLHATLPGYESATLIFQDSAPIKELRLTKRLVPEDDISSTDDSELADAASARDSKAGDSLDVEEPPSSAAPTKAKPKRWTANKPTGQAPSSAASTAPTATEPTAEHLAAAPDATNPAEGKAPETPSSSSGADGQPKPRSHTGNLDPWAE